MSGARPPSLSGRDEFEVVEKPSLDASQFELRSGHMSWTLDRELAIQRSEYFRAALSGAFSDSTVHSMVRTHAHGHAPRASLCLHKRIQDGFPFGTDTLAALVLLIGEPDSTSETVQPSASSVQALNDTIANDPARFMQVGSGARACARAGVCEVGKRRWWQRVPRGQGGL